MSDPTVEVNAVAGLQFEHSAGLEPEFERTLQQEHDLFGAVTNAVREIGELARSHMSALRHHLLAPQIVREHTVLIAAC